MRTTLTRALLGLFLLPTPPALAADVLLLGDTASEAQVQPALAAGGHAVTFGGIYYDWDGVTPDVDAFQVVVLLDGIDYGYDLTPGALAALTGFIARGCGLVVTEWTTYDLYQGWKSPAFGALLPVESPAGAYGESGTWTVVDAGHPLVAGVPASWSDAAGWSTVTALAGSTVVVEGAASNPLLTYGQQHGGVVIHLNHDLTYTTATIEPNALLLLSNAVEFASCLRFLDGFESGDTSAWSATVP